MATLKISDLSVGDWVRCRGRNGRIERLEVIRYDERIRVAVESDLGTMYQFVGIEDIDPIPITAEILEANGFEENCGRWYNSKVLMEFEQYEDGWCRTINCGEYSVYFIKYVHQLQHALRLAGADKEINL